LYVIIALVLTGMVNYSLLDVGDPLAFVFAKLDLKWMSGIIAVCSNCHGECIVGFPNGATTYLDEYES
jgi:hypothetical protein